MIPVSAPDLGPLERAYLLDAFDSGWISSRGDYIERAETALRALTGSPHAVVVNNGTSALHLALLAAGIGPGDEVIIPSLTYVATLNAVYYVGANPVIVDVDEKTWCLDVGAVEAAISPRTSAVIGVDLYGQPADYHGLRSLASAHDLSLIADAAESIGASLDGVAAGSLADISTFSFFGNKVVTSGEGGALTTTSDRFRDKLLQLRNQGNHPTIRYRHDMVGYNYRMTNPSAAVLTAQLERSEELIERRQRVVDRYTSHLSDLPGFRTQEVANGAVASPWMFSIRASGFSGEERDRLIGLMADAGVETRPVFAPMQDMPFVPASQRTETPVARRISEEGLSLPTFPGLTDDEIDLVTRNLIAAHETVLAGRPSGG